MPVYKLSNAGGLTSRQRYTSMLAGNAATIAVTDTGAYFPLQVITVGSATASSITFSNIPSTYTHLQVRAIAKTTTSATKDYEVTYVRFNGDTGSNYALHQITGNGTTAAGGNGVSQTFMYGIYAAKSGPASTFGGGVIDILDYANTNKYKTMRVLSGVDENGFGELGLLSGLWMNTSAITSITFYPPANNYDQYSSFALYGIKAAS